MDRDTDPGRVSEKDAAIARETVVRMFRAWLADPEDRAGFNFSDSIYLHLKALDAEDLMEIMQDAGVSVLYQEGAKPYLENRHMKAFLLITNYDPEAEEARPWERRKK